MGHSKEGETKASRSRKFYTLSRRAGDVVDEARIYGLDRGERSYQTIAGRWLEAISSAKDGRIVQIKKHTKGCIV